MFDIYKYLNYLPLIISGPLSRSRITLQSNALRNCTFKVAETKEELEAAYRLLYEVYLGGGHILPNKRKMRVHHAIFLPNTTTFICKKEERVVSTLSIVKDSTHGVPLDVMFKDKTDQIRLKNESFAEIGGLATDPTFRNYNHNIFYHVVKLMFLYSAFHIGLDNLVMVTNPRRYWLYKNIFLFQEIGEERENPHVVNERSIAMRLDLKNFKENYLKVYKNKPAHKNMHHFLFHQKDHNIHFPENNKPLEVWTPELIEYFKAA